MAISRRLRDRVLARDGGICVINLDVCTTVAEVADHRANRGAGGAKSLDGMSNLIAACSFCNGMKEMVHGEIRDLLVARGVRVESHSTHRKTAQRARETPVYYPDGKRYLLDDDGGKELHHDRGN